jgi:hypothetical protein
VGRRTAHSRLAQVRFSYEKELFCLERGGGVYSLHNRCSCMGSCILVRFHCAGFPGEWVSRWGGGGWLALTWPCAASGLSFSLSLCFSSHLFPPWSYFPRFRRRPHWVSGTLMCSRWQPYSPSCAVLSIPPLIPAGMGQKWGRNGQE